MNPGRSWWLGLALLLSVGVNLGVLAAIAGGWWAHRGHGGEAPGVEVSHGPVHPPSGGFHGTADPGVEPHPEPGTAPVDDIGPGPLGYEGSEFRPGEDGLTVPPDAALRRHLPPLDRMADHLGLAGERRQRFLELQREVFLGIARSRIQRRALTRQLYLELAAETPDRRRVDALLDELARLHDAAERRTAEGILDSRELLGPEEQRRYLGILRRLHADGPPSPGRGGRRGPHGRRPG